MFFFYPPFLFIIFLHIDRILGNERKKKPKLTRAEDLPPFPLPFSLFPLPRRKRPQSRKKSSPWTRLFLVTFFWGGGKTFWVFFFFLAFLPPSFFFQNCCWWVKKMPQLNGGGGDDLGANDELISFKDEGEQEEKSSENSSAERDLADVKSSLVNESETNQNSSSDSEVGKAPRAGGVLSLFPGLAKRCREGRNRGRGRRGAGRAACARGATIAETCNPVFSPPPKPLHPADSFSPPSPPSAWRLPLALPTSTPPGRRKDGLRLAPKVSEINPGKVWKKVSTPRAPRNRPEPPPGPAAPRAPAPRPARPGRAPALPGRPATWGTF